jgi:ABC-type Mn2+/Zn2+ transport system ATPase subunit
VNAPQTVVRTAGTPVLRAADLAIGYDAETVISGIQFELPTGRSLALVGVNGSGKSTLLKTVAGLLPAQEGSLTVFGDPPGKNPRRVGYLSQFHPSGFILPLSAAEVVRMGRYANHGLLERMTKADEDLVRRSMERMGVLSLADAPLRSLSGGQQQRVYLAQVLAREADLLILDEPTAGLDEAGKELYLQAVNDEMNRCAAVVVATHDLQEAMACDLTMLMARRVVAFGRGEDILTREALLEAFGIVLTVGEDKVGLTVVPREHGCR